MFTVVHMALYDKNAKRKILSIEDVDELELLDVEVLSLPMPRSPR